MLFILPLPLSSLILFISQMSIFLSFTSLCTLVMSFCLKSLHSLFSFSLSPDPAFKPNNNVTAIESPRRTPATSSPGISVENVVHFPEAAVVKKDPGGIGFLDEVGGCVDGLMSCTESLGFESSDERRFECQIGGIQSGGQLVASRTIKCRRAASKSTEVKKFPPPISSLDHNGRPTFLLRSVRRDGRLELAGVKIERPEILHASREDGRLRLHLIREAYEEEEEETEEASEEEGAEKSDKKWAFPVKSAGGEGLRRCHEILSRGHHHHGGGGGLHGWRQPCLTIR
ncbi:uncharacterized protein LOC127793801 [Diospyros lotus]|uniref:uncharacterized protein LOC127793801 n=1 Tax=Diospyros lotus TaxID=55363 RepID=UPI00225629A9|nr:uncharacterized protein LOC127793801 [Diospyros lotus]